MANPTPARSRLGRALSAVALAAALPVVSTLDTPAAAATPVLNEVNSFDSSDIASGDRFGYSVDVDGSRAVVGAPGDNLARGAAYVFLRQADGTWAEEARLVATGNDANANLGDEFGTSVSISGNRVLVGAPRRDANVVTAADSGAAYVFDRSGGSWGFSTILLAGTGDQNADDRFGASVDVDGSRIAVGAPGDASGAGAVYAYRNILGNWNLDEKLTAATPAAGEEFGTGVSISGTTVAAGAPGDGGGTVTVFDPSPVPPGFDLTRTVVPNGVATGDLAGSHVALDGTTLAFSGPGASSGRGKAWVYTGAGETFQQALTASDGAAGDGLGPISVRGDFLAVGAPDDDHSSQNGAGTAYAFQRSAGVWSETAILRASDAGANHGLGRGVATQNGLTLAGAPGQGGRGRTYSFDSAPPVVSISVPGTTFALAPGALDATASVNDTSRGGSSVTSAALRIVEKDVVPPGGAAVLGKTFPMTAADGAFDEASETVNRSVSIEDFDWNKTYTICVTGTDQAGLSTETCKDFTINDNLGPKTTGVRTADSTNRIVLGSGATIVATVSDAATGNRSVAAAEVQVNGGAFQTMSATDGTFNTPTESVTRVLSAANFPSAGLYDVCVRGRDAGGSNGPVSCFKLSVQDTTGPDMTGVDASPSSVDFGDPFTVTGTADDSSTGESNIKSAQYTLALAGQPGFEGPFPMAAADGTFDEPVEPVTAEVGPSRYGIAGEFEVCVNATDVSNASGPFDCDTVTVVDNAGPDTKGVVFEPGAFVKPGSTVTVRATIDDASQGASTVKTAQVTIGGSSPVTMTPDDGAFDSSIEVVSHTFTAPSADGTSIELCITGTDALDNVGAQNCKTVTTDGTPPSLSNVSIPDSVVFGQDLPLSFTGNDGQTGISGGFYSVRHLVFTKSGTGAKAADASFQPLPAQDGTYGAATEAVSGKATASGDLPLTGRYEICVRVTDKANNAATQCKSITVNATAPGTPPAARSNTSACPPSRVPNAGFVDLPPSNVHAFAVNCIAWYGITSGKPVPGHPGVFAYDPAAQVTRAQMATFIATLIRQAGGTLDANAVDAFSDDGGSVHHSNINALAKAGVVAGTGGSNFSPELPVKREQMATFLNNAFRFLTSSSAPFSRDYFPDDGNSVHQNNINAMAEAGVASGKAGGLYDPAAPVLRDQMGSFLTRLLDLVTDLGLSTPPT